MMEKVTGIGGIFFKANDPKKLSEWYRDFLGMPIEDWGGAIFPWHEASLPKRSAFTVWSPFAVDTDYFLPSDKPFMLNLRVADRDAMLKQLRRMGAAVDERIQDSADGRFGWVMDPEGNRIELWEPPLAE